MVYLATKWVDLSMAILNNQRVHIQALPRYRYS